MLAANYLLRYYKALSFYLQEQPMLLNDLLTVLTPRIEHTRVVRLFQRSDNVPLIKPYLIAVQEVRIRHSGIYKLPLLTYSL